jgi:hypothetical protein
VGFEFDDWIYLQLSLQSLVITNNYNFVAHLHNTNRFTLSLLSLFYTNHYLVTALLNDSSSAVFSLDVSW